VDVFRAFHFKLLALSALPFSFTLFTPLFSVACKMRMYFRFFGLSTVVDNSVRNLSAFSFSKSEGEPDPGEDPLWKSFGKGCWNSCASDWEIKILRPG
jgi:hypothetical protein